MIDLAILGLLKENPLHGYELKKRLRDLLGPLTRVSFGSLYPALARLERDGAVRALADEDAPAIPIPMTGSLGGEAAAFRAARLLGRNTRGRRGKKVYDITPQGEARLAELLQAGDDDDRTFTLKLAFARHLAAEARLALLERRRAQLEARLADARRSLAQSATRFDVYTRSIREHDVESTQHDISWLGRLMEAEHQAAGRRPPAPDHPAEPAASPSGAAAPTHTTGGSDR